MGEGGRPGCAAGQAWLRSLGAGSGDRVVSVAEEGSLRCLGGV